jgi:ectoine hydroxylase-related dioxygenase (phytanoyl-CoA dioxygenase family)
MAHVQPPAGVLSRILAIRLHLDESGAENGPLRVIPGSHRQGRPTAEEVAEWTNRDGTICTVSGGGAALMRCLLHASSTYLVARPRRALHLEFVVDELRTVCQSLGQWPNWLRTTSRDSFRRAVGATLEALFILSRFVVSTNR